MNENVENDGAGPVVATTTIGMRQRTYMGISRLAEREGVSFDTMIDRLLSFPAMIADEAERGRYLCFARLDQERGKASDVSPILAMGSKPWSLTY